MAEVRFFEEGTVPAWTTPEWYSHRENAPHLEESSHVGRLLKTAELINELEPMSVVDLGAGDGGLLSKINLDKPFKWGYDLQQTNVDVAANLRQQDVSLLDVVANPNLVEWGDLAVATEMLEHLLDPHGFVRWVYDNANVFVASSPWNEVAGHHYEFHTWAWDFEGFRAIFESAGYEVVQHVQVDTTQILVGVKS